jgi:hypothetical protein
MFGYRITNTGARYEHDVPDRGRRGIFPSLSSLRAISPDPAFRRTGIRLGHLFIQESVHRARVFRVLRSKNRWGNSFSERGNDVARTDYQWGG